MAASLKSDYVSNAFLDRIVNQVEALEVSNLDLLLNSLKVGITEQDWPGLKYMKDICLPDTVLNIIISNKSCSVADSYFCMYVFFIFIN